MPKLFTVGQLTRHLRELHKCKFLEYWHVTRAIKKSNIKLERVGILRVIELADIPIIEAALVDAGYLVKKGK